MEPKAKILLLEDDSDLRSLLERILGYHDYEVTSVENGFEAIEAVKQNSFDLIVADIRVDGPDGIEVLSEAKRDRPDVGTLAVSGYSSLEDDARAERLGVGGFLRKPFETQRFLELVQQQLHKRRKKQKEKNHEQEVAAVFMTTLNTLFLAYAATPEENASDTISRAREMAMKLGVASGLQGPILHQVAAAAALITMPPKIVGELCKSLTELTPYVDSLSEALLYHDRPNDHDPRPPLEARIVRLVKAVLDDSNLDEAGLDKELVALYRSENTSASSVTAGQKGPGQQSESFLAIAQTLERAGDIAGAAVAYKELLQNQPQGEAKVEAQLGMARLAVMAKERDKVRLWVDRATQTAATIGRFRSCLTDYYGGLLLRQVGDSEAKRLLRRAVPSLLKFGFADAVALSAVALIAEGEKVDQERWQAISRRLLSPSLSQDITKHAVWFIPALLETLSKHPVPGFLSGFINHLPRLFCKLLEEQLLAPQDRSRLVNLLKDQDSQVPESVWKLLRQDADQDVRQEAKKLNVRVESVASPSLIRLSSMGPLEVQVDGETIPDRVWRTQRTRLLLGYLSYEWGRQVHEEVLLEEVWGDLDSTDKRGLYWCTSSIRRIFKELGFQVDIIERIGETLRCNPTVSVWHDVTVLETNLATAQQALEEGQNDRAKVALQSALEVYRGPYLEGCFLEWALNRRQSLERQTADGALTLAGLHFDSEDYRESVEAARVSLKFDPTRQDAHLMVMKALIKGGRPEAAIDQYHECEKLLRQTYGTEPETIMIEYFHRAKMLM